MMEKIKTKVAFLERWIKLKNLSQNWSKKNEKREPQAISAMKKANVAVETLRQ